MTNQEGRYFSYVYGRPHFWGRIRVKILTFSLHNIFHYALSTNGQKLQQDKENNRFRAITLTRLMGGTNLGKPFQPKRQT